jgi:hypothetical protein
MRDEARPDVLYYIEGFYNRRRLPSSLGYQSPEACEQLLRLPWIGDPEKLLECRAGRLSSKQLTGRLPMK